MYNLLLEEHVIGGRLMFIVAHRRPDLSFMDVIHQANLEKPILNQRHIFVSPASMRLSAEDEYLWHDGILWKGDNAVINGVVYPDLRCIVKEMSIGLHRVLLLISNSAELRYVSLKNKGNGVVLVCEKDEDISMFLQYFQTL